MVEGTINSCNSLFYYLEKKFNIDHQLMNWKAILIIFNPHIGKLFKNNINQKAWNYI